ncbi:MAG: helix-turn-helix domain-containing protein [Nanoarchaeota archaeon]
MDISALKEAGLTEGEIKVFLALLELGSSTSGPIVEKSGISRSIIYQILEKLMHKGLVSSLFREKTMYFQAAEPAKLLEFIDDREERLKENRAIVEKLLPELLLKQKFSKKSQTSMYFGYRGLRTAHEHLYLKLKKGEEYCYLGVPSGQSEELHAYWKKDHLRRIRDGIRCRLLFNKDTSKSVLKNRNAYKLCDARYMESNIKTPAGFMTYKDTIVIMILDSPSTIAVEIVNQDIADSFQAYFEEFWRRSRKFKKM